MSTCLVFADLKSQASYVSETGTCARFLLPKVHAHMQGGAKLEEAVRLAEAEANDAFAAHGLSSIHDIVSGRPGGLGKAKARLAKPA